MVALVSLKPYTVFEPFERHIICYRVVAATAQNYVRIDRFVGGDDRPVFHSDIAVVTNFLDELAKLHTSSLFSALFHS